MFYVYVLSNKKGQLYVGSTKDLKRRLLEHSKGQSHTTKNLKTDKLIFYEAFLSKYDALRRERYFKTTKGKHSLIQIVRRSILI